MLGQGLGELAQLGGDLRLRAAILAIVLLLAIPGNAAVSATTKPAWTPFDFWASTEKGLNSVLLFDSPDRNGSFLRRLTNNNYPEPYWAFGSDGGACEIASEVFCVEGLSVVKGGRSTPTLFEKQLISDEHSGVPDTPIPPSKGSSLWSLEEAGGAKAHYIVRTRIDGSYLEASKAFPANGAMFKASISLVDETPFQPQTTTEYQSCLIWIHTTNDCFVTFDMPRDTAFSLQVRLPKFVGGWYYSRVSGLQVALDAKNPNFNLWTFQGSPSLLSSLYYSYAPLGNEELTAKIYKVYGAVPSDVRKWDGLSHNVTGWFRGSNYVVSALRPVLGDRATADYTGWSIGSYNYLQTNPCFAGFDRVHGFVSTNAMAYSPEPPEFKDGYFSYQVSNTHRHANGDVVSGEFTFVVDSTLARCLYGFSNAPISATVAVVGEQGTEQVATTVVSERGGWLTLSANGFTYSDKEIRVKLSQAQVVVPTKPDQKVEPFVAVLTKFLSSGATLSSKQKTELRAAVRATVGKKKFICTGTHFGSSTKSLALSRARSACAFAKTLDPSRTFFSQTKQTSNGADSSKVSVSAK